MAGNPLASVQVIVQSATGARFGISEPVATVEDLISILVKATATLAAEASERGYDE